MKRFAHNSTTERATACGGHERYADPLRHCLSAGSSAGRLSTSILRRSSSGTSSTRRGGFTLVEMLVSIALVLLIMSLFAQAFSIAANSIHKQRGVAENDQRVRSLVTILLGDLTKRTYRQREDAVTETIPIPEGIEDLTDPIERQIFILNRVENRANRKGLGIVPLHPDYFIGGGSATLPAGPAPVDATEAWTNGAALRNVDSVFERGYFYYSEGDTSNDADDILKFTIDVSQTDLGNEDTTKLIGRAVALGPTQTPFNPTGPVPPVIGSGVNLNQPIWDDGIGQKEKPDGNVRSYLPGESGSTASDLAEIAYFVRDGKLYRRIHLIRQPLGVVPTPGQVGQPSDDSPGGEFPAFTSIAPGAYRVDPGPGPSTGFGGVDFWQDFDFGATRFEDVGAAGSRLRMYDEAMLDNTIGGPVTAGQFPFSHPHRFWALGDPRNRFGHDATYPPPNNRSGRPKEYMNPANPSTYIGLYTHEETSHPDFDFPGQPTYNGGTTSPMQYGTAVPLATFDNGPRAGEDILLSNCHGFDVKVWDEVLGKFVDMGHAIATPAGVRGDWHHASVVDNSIPPDPTPGTDFVGQYQAPHWPLRGGMISYGGRNQENRVFDTWHPAFNYSVNLKVNEFNSGQVERPDDDPPPHRPLWSDRDNFFGPASTLAIPIESEGPNFGLPNPPGGNPSGIRYWQANEPYQPSARVFPRPNLIGGNQPMPTHQSFFYQLDLSQSIDFDDDGFYTSPDLPTNQPVWPEAPGARTPPQTDPVTGDVTVWKAINNTIGLKAIQISVRFFDPTSGQMRQMTLTHSFVEM